MIVVVVVVVVVCVCVCVCVCMYGFVSRGFIFLLPCLLRVYVLPFEKRYFRMFRFDLCDSRLLQLRVADGCPLLF